MQENKTEKKNEKKEKKEKKISYTRINFISKILSPVLKLAYYVFIVGILLCILSSLILLFVGGEPQDMLMPFDMSYDAELNEFEITIGNGIHMYALKNVETSDIKTVMYAQIMMLVAFFATAAPVCLFLSKLMKNYTKGDPFDLKNARLMIFIGLTVTISQTVVAFIGNFYNYLLVNTFATDSYQIQYAPSFSFTGILIGLLIIICAHFYGNVCEKHLEGSTSTDVVPK